MTGEDRARITSDEYADILVEYRGNPQLLQVYQDAVIQIMNEVYAIAYVPVQQFTNPNSRFRYAEIPSPFGLTDEASLDASGITELRNFATFNLRGEGVLVAIIDTGIDYLNPAFIREDQTTKIVSIWDQTIESEISPFNTEFGTEYTMEQINQALASDAPLEIVPSMDEIGHGTTMAAIAVGNDNPSENFYGVVPDAELIVVKLRQAKQPLRDFYVIPEGTNCYQENNLMWGLHYCYLKSNELRRPVVICLGSGTSMDAHDGLSPLCVMCNLLADVPNVVVVSGVGNEGNKGRHFYGIIEPNIGSTTVELNVAEGEFGFTMVLWGDAPGIFSIDILSPSGEFIPRIPVGIRVNRVLSFIFETTVIHLDYHTVESQTGDQLILFRFQNVSSGIWRINVYGQSNLAAGFHIWLPMGDFISSDTYFIQPNIYTTTLSPATARIPIAVTAYNPVNGNLYVNSGRGYTRSNVIKPELAAPGVNYIAPSSANEYTTHSGSSVATAHSAGIAAMVLEWGTVRNNSPGMDSLAVKNFLIRGANRRQNLNYPNRDWGFGIIDILNAFDFLRAHINV